MKKRSNRKIDCGSLPFSAEEYAEYLELYDISQDDMFDAFSQLDGNEREKAIDIANQLTNDLEDAFSKLEKTKVKTLDEMMVHLDLSLSKWRLPSNFIIDVIKNLDEKQLLSGLFISSTDMIISLISHGIFDEWIKEDRIFDFFEYLIDRCNDTDEINSSDAVLHITSEWIDRKAKL